MKWKNIQQVSVKPARSCGWLKTAVIAATVGLGIHATAPQADAAGLLIADGGLGGALEIKEHDVQVTINNGIAVTQVTQVFQNLENRQVEALYTFPVPRGASVSNFSMWINGKEMVGEVVEKKRAREIYDSYKRVRRDPGLLEQVDYRTFEMRIFPIAARAEQRVQVTYAQELNFDNDWATYVYPLATQTRADIDAKVTGKFAIRADVKSEIPIVELESPSHAKDFAVANHNEKYAEASLEATGGDLSRDVVLSFHVSRPYTGLDIIHSKESSEDGYFAMTFTAGEELAALEKKMDYVFVVDVSGSMRDEGKLDLSRRSVAAFVDALGPDDRFEVIAFNVKPESALGAMSAATDENKSKARDFLSSRQPRGGTVLQSAMQTAYRYADPARPLNVIILSDGMTDHRDRTELMKLIGERPAESRVFCIGVGNDVQRALLEQLAHDSGGLAAFVSRDDDFARQASAFRRKLLRPVITDIKFDFTGVDVYDIEPQQLPNLYHGMPVRVYGRYKSGGEGKVTLTGNVVGQPMTQSVPLDFPKSDPDNPQIERMWAWQRVDRLLKQADAQGDRTPVIDEIIRLGEGYSIMSEYTSFIVLENDGEYQRWKINRANALRVERDRAAQAKLNAELEQMRTAATEALGPVTKDAPKQIAMAPQVNDAPQMSSPVRPPSSNRDSGRDIHILPRGGGGGGGAIDPLTGAIVLILGAIAAKEVSRRRDSED